MFMRGGACRDTVQRASREFTCELRETIVRRAGGDRHGWASVRARGPAVLCSGPARSPPPRSSVRITSPLGRMGEPGTVRIVGQVRAALRALR